MEDVTEVKKHVLKGKLMMLSFRPQIVDVCDQINVVTDHILVPPFSQREFVIELINHCRSRSPLDHHLYDVCAKTEALPSWDLIDAQSEKTGGWTKYLFDILEWLIPTPGQTHQEFESQYSCRISDNSDEIANAIIARTSILTGLLGALSGIGGFLFMLFALPADLLLSLRLQTKMAQMIGYAYGYTNELVDLRTVSLVIIAGEAAIADIVKGVERAILRRATRRASRKLGTRLLWKSLAQFIPLIGALLGFALNYYITKSAGKILIGFYKGEFSLEDLRSQTKDQIQNGGLQFVKWGCASGVILILSCCLPALFLMWRLGQ